MARALYHHVQCKHLKAVRLQLTKSGHAHKHAFAMLGVSSKDTIRTALRAVDASPFKTVFVVDEQSGNLLYALSQNDAYVEAARKKDRNPNPPPPPPPSPSECCQLCYAQGGYACDTLSDGSCICYGANRGTGGTNVDDTLETLAF